MVTSGGWVLVFVLSSSLSDFIIVPQRTCTICEGHGHK